MVEIILPFLALLLGIVNGANRKVLYVEVTLDLLFLVTGVTPFEEYYGKTEVIEVNIKGGNDQEAI